MNTEERLIVGGVVVVGGFLLFSRASSVHAAQPLRVAPTTREPSWLDKLLNAAKGAAASFGSGGGSMGAGAGGGGGASGGGRNPAGDSFDFIGNLRNGDNDLNFDGSLASAPLSYDNGNTVDLNMVDPSSGDQFFSVPDNAPSADGTALLDYAHDVIDNGPAADDTAPPDGGGDFNPADLSSYDDGVAEGDGF